MDHYKRFLRWDDKRRWDEQKARIMAAEPITESHCERLAREAKEAKRRGRAISTHLGAEATCQPYNHWKDCRRWMTEADFARDWEGSEAVMVRKSRSDDGRVLVHLCGKAGPKCRIAAVFNRIPDSRVSKSDTTDMVAGCHSRADRPLMDVHRGYVQGALRDCQTAYYMAKPRVNPQGMTDA